MKCVLKGVFCNYKEYFKKPENDRLKSYSAVNKLQGGGNIVLSNSQWLAC